MQESWNARLEELYEQMVDWRREMHKYPELSNEEVRTSAMIAEILTGFGIEIQTGVGGTGVVGIIRGAKPGKTIALRADFDALPIQDEKEVAYKSTVPGVMHACGHDGHTATLLAVAKVLSEHRDDLSGNVVLLHQHAEELIPGGARDMIKDGCLDGVDAVFGTHLWTPEPFGRLAYRKGYIMAATDEFSIKIQGHGGHGSAPHQTVDSIAIGAQLINQLQLVVSRQIDPLKSAVLTVGTFHAGNAANVIPDSATLTGTVRSFDKEVRSHIEEEINTIAKNVCAAFHASCEYSYTRGYPAVYNHEKETDEFIEAIKEGMDENMLVEVEPVMGGEDFAYYLKEKPGMFFFTGAGNEKIGANFPHHHPRFDFDERAMLTAGKALLSIVFHYLVLQKDRKALELNL
ncbi:M20 family metallopeptidase [Bacillota bacterium Lsc_1132]